MIKPYQISYLQEIAGDIDSLFEEIQALAQNALQIEMKVHKLLNDIKNNDVNTKKWHEEFANLRRESNV